MKCNRETRIKEILEKYRFHCIGEFWKYEITECDEGWDELQQLIEPKPDPLAVLNSRIDALRQLIKDGINIHEHEIRLNELIFIRWELEKEGE